MSIKDKVAKKATKETKVAAEAVEEFDIINEVSQILEKDFETKVSKKDIKAVISAYTDVLAEATFINGTTRLGKFGKLVLNPVAAKTGTTKLSGKAQEWSRPAQWTIKLRVYPGTFDEIDALEKETGKLAANEFKE